MTKNILSVGNIVVLIGTRGVIKIYYNFVVKIYDLKMYYFLFLIGKIRDSLSPKVW